MQVYIVKESVLVLSSFSENQSSVHLAGALLLVCMGCETASFHHKDLSFLAKIVFNARGSINTSCTHFYFIRKFSFDPVLRLPQFLMIPSLKLS